MNLTDQGIMALGAERDRAVAKLEATRQTMLDVTTERDHLRDEVRALNARVTQLVDERDTHRAHSNRVSAEMAATALTRGTAAADMARTMGQLLEDRDAHADRVKVLAAQITVLERTLADRDREIEALRERLSCR